MGFDWFFAVCVFLLGAFLVGFTFWIRNKKSEENELIKEAYDPLDGKRLTEPVDLEIDHPEHGPVMVKVNRENLRKYQEHGPKAFPYLRRSHSRYSDQRYLVSNPSSRSSDSGFDLLDAIIFYQIFLADDHHVNDGNWSHEHGGYSGYGGGASGGGGAEASFGAVEKSEAESNIHEGRANDPLFGIYEERGERTEHNHHSHDVGQGDNDCRPDVETETRPDDCRADDCRASDCRADDCRASDCQASDCKTDCDCTRDCDCSHDCTSDCSSDCGGGD